jgi:hypothetical protein
MPHVPSFGSLSDFDSSSGRPKEHLVLFCSVLFYRLARSAGCPLSQVPTGSSSSSTRKPDKRSPLRVPQHGKLEVVSRTSLGHRRSLDIQILNGLASVFSLVVAYSIVIP